MYGVMDLGPWLEKPVVDGKSKGTSAGVRLAEQPSSIADVQRSLDQPSPANDYSNDRFNFARLELVNRSTEEAKRIRIVIDRSSESQDILVLKKGSEPQFIKGHGEFTIPDLAPGEVCDIYIWSKIGFWTILFPEQLETFSSLGPIRLDLRWPKTRSSIKGDWLFQSLDDWMFTVIITLLIITRALGLLMSALYETYYKKLLVNDDFYLNERERFESNPKKFQIKLE